MSLLSMIQDVSDNLGINRPNAVINNNDPQIRQMLAIAQNEGDSLSKRNGKGWTSMVLEFEHLTLAQENQGAVVDIMPGIDWPKNQSFWDRTQQERVTGPLTSAGWQLEVANVSAGPYYSYRFWQRDLYLYPAPPAGNTMAGEYVSKYWCESSIGAAQEKWLADTDAGILDEELMKLGILWRWNQRKGFDYAEDFRTYENEVHNAIGRDGGARIIRSGRVDFNPQDSVTVPEGSWPVT